MKLFEEGHEENGWWTKHFISAEELAERIKVMRYPAKHAGEIEKWADTIDFIAAAILYDMNFVICSRRKTKNGDDNIYWELHTPERMIDTVNKRSCD